MTRRRRTALISAGAAVAAVLVIAGILLSASPPARRPIVGVASPAEQNVAGSRDTALDAGAHYATLVATLLPLDPTAAAKIVDDAASDAYRPTLHQAVLAELLPLQRRVAALPGRPVYHQGVLAVRLADFNPRRAHVSCWVMLVAGQAGANSNVVATFATVTVSIVFERSAWRLDGSSEDAGPSPQVGDAPSTTDDLETRLAGFGDWRPAR